MLIEPVTRRLHRQMRDAGARERCQFGVQRDRIGCGERAILLPSRRADAERADARRFTEGAGAAAGRKIERFARSHPGEILLSQMEHHSNIVPWQMIAEKRRAKVRFAPINDDGSIDVKAFKALLSPRTKIVSLVQLAASLPMFLDDVSSES